MVHTTTPEQELAAYESEGGSHLASRIDHARRLFRDRSRYHSRALDRIFGSQALDGTPDRHPACQIMTSEQVEDEADESIVRGID